MSDVLFSFGIITDTHIRPPQGDKSSPFPVNDKANSRARYATQLLAAQNPAFTIHMGDVVHTLPHMPLYDDACVEAMQILQPLQPQLHFMAGNHDIGDKPMPASPAKGVSDTFTQRYSQHFGSQWRSFDVDSCRFVIINSSLINSGVEDEKTQAIWLEEILNNASAEANGKRVFLFAHYPPFIFSEDEHEHYDNIASPGREWLLSLIRRHAVEILFSGHVHQFFYNRLDTTTLYCLPPTSFIRQDYAELFRTGPSNEYGRDDAGKMSVAMVDIHTTGHTLRVLPTDGQELQSGETFKLPAVTDQQTTDTGSNQSICVSLKHAWHEAVDLPYNGPMEEYSRKRARNDYTLLRLFQMNVTKVRAPLQDLIDPVIRARVVDYHLAGIRFHFFVLGTPSASGIQAIRDNSELVCSVEIVSPLPEPNLLLEEQCTELITLLSTLKKPLMLSKAHSSAAQSTSTGDKTFAHSVSNGFLVSESEELTQWLDSNLVNSAIQAGATSDNLIDAVVYQLPLEDDIKLTIQQLDNCYRSRTESVIINVKFANENPAIANFDDNLILQRYQHVVSATQAYENIDLHFDTFADIDRGYGPRHGFVDRLFNLRPLGKFLTK